MSYFDDASLVLIPSGYKDQKIFSVKPLDGSGDLTFSRASNATRVASDGLIEKVRTNLVTYSNTFSDAAWTKTNSTVTSGQAGYDGTTNGWKITATGANNDKIIQSVSTTGLITASVYAKAGNVNFVIIGIGGAATWFNLSSGAVGANISALNPKIESVGNGYYRCSISVANLLSTNFELYLANSNGNTTTSAGDYILLQNSQVETGDIATDYIATTTTAVSVGPVSGLPRLDYLNSTCPRLLLEPQRSNFVTFSEQLNNAAWLKSGVTLTSNNAISPSGYQDADLMTYSSAGSRVMSQLFVVSATSLAVSVYVKGVSGNGANFLVFDSTASSVKGDVSFTGNTFTPASSSFSAKSESVGNGWYRISMVVPIVSGNNNRLYLYTDSNGGTISGSSLLAWGFQAEAASYPSSYIPTLGTSVTRVADAASKTGISSLIGQTEGTVFLEIETLPQSGDFFTITPASGSFYSNGMGIGFFSGTLRFQLYSSTNISSILGVISGKNKIALAYKSGNTSIYINGVSVFTSSTTFSFSVALSGLTLQSAATISGAISQSRSNQFLLFPTRLTNAQLAELTA